jgi:hypothetical protein
VILKQLTVTKLIKALWSYSKRCAKQLTNNRQSCLRLTRRLSFWNTVRWKITEFVIVIPSLTVKIIHIPWVLCTFRNWLTLLLNSEWQCYVMQMANEGQNLINYATVLWSEKRLRQIHFRDKQEACDRSLTIPRELFRPGNEQTSMT